jgi:molybdopterin/thiamine biosynthesis adenylyltransferase/rhodanese-related sulfurtransferase
MAVRLTPPSQAGLPERAVLVDVREASERRAGHIEDAAHIPLGNLVSSLPQVLPDRDLEIVFYCATGARSAMAAAFAASMGYTRTSSLDGGIESWVRAGQPWVNPGELSDDQVLRYQRHIILPDVGARGQARLLNTRIAIVGAGGLGSPVALYLAAAGVGALGIIDGDTVDSGNLQRQIIHDIDHIGRPKAESVRERLAGLNPDVKVEVHSERLDASNALRILSGYDLVIDATDNFPTRYLVNDVALHLRIPVVHASIYRFEGQVSVFDPYNGPCYRCIFPLPPPPEIAASCDTGGVLGVLPGVVGTMQATEALKLALGIGEPLVGRLMLYDALAQTTSELRVNRDPSCAACGDEGHPPALVDYDDSCSPT